MGAADGPAKPVAVQGRSRKLVAPIVGIKHGVLHKLKQRAVELVGSRFGEYVDYTAGKPAIFGIVVVGLDPEFLHRVGIRKYVSGIAQSSDIDSTVQIVVQRARASLHAAAEQCALLGIAEHEAALLPLYP